MKLLQKQATRPELDSVNAEWLIMLNIHLRMFCMIYQGGQQSPELWIFAFHSVQCLPNNSPVNNPLFSINITFDIVSLIATVTYSRFDIRKRSEVLKPKSDNYAAVTLE